MKENRRLPDRHGDFFSDSGGVLVVDNWRWNIRDMAFWMRRWLAVWGPKDDRLALEIQTRID